MYSYKDYYANKISAKKYLISKLKTYICTDIYDSTMIKETMQTAELTPCTESKFPLVEGIRFFTTGKPVSTISMRRNHFFVQTMQVSVSRGSSPGSTV